MGGNALKNHGVERVNPETYNRIKEHALKILGTLKTEVHIPPELPGKKDYGDIDILIRTPKKPIYQWIQENFQPRAIIVNDNIYSFPIEHLQIDLIVTPPKKWEIAKVFYSWGDLSMAIGRVARLYGLKYGINGLELPIRDPNTNHVTELLTVSRNPRKIFTFLGYDFERFKKGFKTEDEVKNFLFSSKKIHQGFLTAASENTQARKRDRERPTFSKWLKWANQNQHLFPEIPPKPEYNETINILNKTFPESDIANKLQQIQQRLQNKQKAAAKFNGTTIIGKYPELSKQEIQKLIRYWQIQSFENNITHEIILKTPIETLYQNLENLKQNLATLPNPNKTHKLWVTHSQKQTPEGKIITGAFILSNWDNTKIETKRIDFPLNTPIKKVKEETTKQGLKAAKQFNTTLLFLHTPGEKQTFEPQPFHIEQKPLKNGWEFWTKELAKGNINLPKLPEQPDLEAPLAVIHENKLLEFHKPEELENALNTQISEHDLNFIQTYTKRQKPLKTKVEKDKVTFKK